MLRLACIAVSESKPEFARKILLIAEEKHAKRSRLARKRANAPLKRAPLGELYTAVFARCDANRQDTTAESLAALTSELGLDPKPVSTLRKRRNSPS